MVRINQLVMLGMVLVLMCFGRQVFAANEAVNDVRILIDVSGSMKKNDPQNLRIPALDMVVELLPPESKSGVWTFAKYVNMLVPHKSVDDPWREQAKQQTGKIHSNGLFTDIEQVMNRATKNLTQPDKSSRRSVILLSDGLVDINPEAQPNIDSKQRILKEVVPRLKQADIAVHTIALSDASDQALLREIALETDGWYEQVDNAQQLQRVFLHLFEKAAERDTVPIEDNQFMIDDSVTEMTLLVFRRADAVPTQLVMPNQTILTHETENEAVRWLHHEAGYDLITIANPDVGEWSIQAAFDPDNRVMILTDLQLQTTELPNNIVIGENVDFDINLTNKGDVIEREQFLDLLDVTISHENEVSDIVTENLNETVRQGIYRTQVGDTFESGRNDVVTTVKSATFERQRRQSINVVAMPFSINMEQLLEQETRTHRLTLVPDSSLVNTQKMTIAAMLMSEDGNEWSYDVMPAEDNTWQLTLTELEPNKTYTVNVQIKTETLTGRTLFLQPDAMVLTDEQLELVPVDDITDQISQELATLGQEQATDLSAEESLIGDDDVLNMNDDVIAPIDELDGEIGDLNDLLANDDLGEELTLIDDKNESEVQVSNLSSQTMMIGNVIFILIAVAGIYLWRRQTATSQNPVEQL